MASVRSKAHAKPGSRRHEETKGSAEAEAAALGDAAAEDSCLRPKAKAKRQSGAALAASSESPESSASDEGREVIPGTPGEGQREGQGARGHQGTSKH